MSASVGERFRNKYIVTPGGCWEWTGGIRKQNGYGVFHIGYRQFLAHRVSYELHVGEIPEGLQIDHQCHTEECREASRCPHRRCVNPKHLKPVTGRNNTLRGATLPAANAKKETCPEGHEYTGYNLMRKKNRRLCRICWNNQQCARRARSAHR